MADELDGRIQELEQSLTTLQSQMRDQLTRAQSATRTSLIVGIIVIAAAFLSELYTTQYIMKETQPDIVAEDLQAKAGEILPTVEKTLTEKAPEYIADLHDEAVAQIPVVGKLAEAKALAFVDDLTNRLAAGTDEIVGKMLQKNAAELKPLVEAAAQPGNAEELQKEFTKDLEETIGPKLDSTLDDYNGAMDVAEHRLDRLLLPDKQLSPDERLEKEMATTLMFYLDETFTPAPTPPPAPK